MTPDTFRQLALALPGAEEGSHMGHADFRVQKKVFATLGYPDDGQAMVKLPAEKQAEFIELEPTAFSSASGAWGRQGCTMVLLAKAREKTIGAALELAWQQASVKKRR
jgi:predicted DNA-binding protein (MmcQ/YjbR family)